MAADKLDPLGVGLAGSSAPTLGDTHAKDAAKLASYATEQFQKEIDKNSGRAATTTSKSPRSRHRRQTRGRPFR